MTHLQTALARVVAGRDCLVMGSAPTKPFILEPPPVAVAVNGGIFNCGGDVDVWVLNARTVHDALNHPLYPTMVAQGANRHVGLLVLFSWHEEDSGAQTLVRLKKQGTTWDSYIDINNPTRRRIETLSGARSADMTKHALSAGLSAVSLCLWAEAATVRLEGCSWTPGYAYRVSQQVFNRGHDVGDKWALARLARSHGDRVRHTLMVPAAFHALATKELQRMPKKVTTTDDPQTFTGPRKVRATKDVYYGGMRHREGDVFTLRAPSHFKPSCMVDVPPDASSARPSIKEYQDRATLTAQAMSGKRLKPNAADPVDGEPGGQGLVSTGASRDVL